MKPTEPTSEQCSNRAEVPGPLGRRAFACWFPQLGGYAGKAIVELEGAGHFDVYLWHDFEFPADTPTVFHCCSARQFVEFGTWVEDMVKVVEIEEAK
jgi:hypothetical protein